MALVPRISICSQPNCKSWFIYDSTGIYVAGSGGNTGGYGTPNPAITQVTGATITFTLSDGTESDEIDLFPTFPNLNNVPFEITNEDLGLTEDDAIPDGATQYTYTISVSGTDYVGQATKYLLCNAECCIARLGSKDISCNKNAKKKFIEASEYIWAIQGAVRCNNIEGADTLLEKLQNLCNSEGCSCSCSSNNNSGGCNC